MALETHLLKGLHILWGLSHHPQVSWVRRKGDELHLITFGQHTYSSDSRYILEYQAPNDWQLLIQFANERDEGHYECQISSHPPLVYIVYLTVVGEYWVLYSSSGIANLHLTGIPSLSLSSVRPQFLGWKLWTSAVYRLLTNITRLAVQ